MPYLVRFPKVVQEEKVGGGGPAQLPRVACLHAPLGFPRVRLQILRNRARVFGLHSFRIIYKFSMQPCQEAAIARAYLACTAYESQVSKATKAGDRN